MTRRSIGIVDYGVGNFASVRNTLHRVGYRCRVSSDPEVLETTDVLILPGVGAFPAAMENLRHTGLGDFVLDQSKQGRPIIGICLGAQLLVDESVEHGVSAGLSLIPGRVVPMTDPPWHIGWNTIENVNDDPLLRSSDGEAVYFNHSYALDVPDEYRLCVTRAERPFVSGIRRENVVGLQFHPEKSQSAGRQILHDLVEGLCDA